jgi:hypothetical protein
MSSPTPPLPRRRPRLYFFLLACAIETFIVLTCAIETSNAPVPRTHALLLLFHGPSLTLGVLLGIRGWPLPMQLFFLYAANIFFLWTLLHFARAIFLAITRPRGNPPPATEHPRTDLYDY